MDNVSAGPGDLGKRVAARRRELGLTRAELAARSGMAVSYLAYLEQHAANVGYDGLMRLADALGTTPNALLGGSAEVPQQAQASQRVRLGVARLAPDGRPADRLRWPRPRGSRWNIPGQRPVRGQGQGRSVVHDVQRRAGVEGVGGG